MMNSKEIAVKNIEEFLKGLENGLCSSELLDEYPELAAKIQENEKLKYRLNILKTANKSNRDGESVGKKRNDCPDTGKYVIVEDYGDSIIEKLNDVFSTALKQTYPDLHIKVSVRETNNPQYGDYQFGSCMQISSFLSTAQNRVKASEIAKMIYEKLEKINLVEKYEIVNAYINIFVNKQHIGRGIAEIFLKGLSIPRISKKHVIVDYSAPNIAKQMHVGHLRSTIIGESICRLLEYLGFSVLRLNHIGDWGTQFGMLIAYLRERFPNYLHETPQIQDLQTFYKESKLKFDEDSEFKAHAYQCVVKLQNFEPDIVNAWKMICDVSRKDFENIYRRLDVHLEERGESFYQSRMQTLVNDLEKTGMLEENQGRMIFFPKVSNIPLTLIKSDGGFTYDTSDLAALRQRLFEENADWVLYVVDRGQSEHLETVFAAARELGWYKPGEKRVEHVQFGLVLGEDKKKFKTRSGETVKLQELLDEGVRRCEDKLRSKEKDKEFSNEEFDYAKEALAYGCIKYADLLQSRIGDYVFSFDRMLDDRGNTAVYLMYAYARIRSIARNAQITRDQLNEHLAHLENGIVSLEHPRETRLAKHILKFSDCLLLVTESLQLNKICDYVYELATIFHDFYNECYVICKNQDGDTTVNLSRLVLCEVAADVMQQCFHILGIRQIERM